MPVKTWATNDVPTASDLNTQFRDQVISQVTSGTRPGGTEGQMIYETDTDLCYIYNGGWVRFGAGGGWTSFTPTITQSGAVTKTVNYAKYEKIGRLVNVLIYMTVTGTGTAANNVTVTLPFTAASTAGGGGSGFILDSSAGFTYGGHVELNSTTSFGMYPTSSSPGVGQYLGQTNFTAALAVGDVIKAQVAYESST